MIMMTGSPLFNDMANGAESHARCLHTVALMVTRGLPAPVDFKEIPSYEAAEKYIANNPWPDYLTVEILWLRQLIETCKP